MPPSNAFLSGTAPVGGLEAAGIGGGGGAPPLGIGGGGGAFPVGKGGGGGAFELGIGGGGGALDPGIGGAGGGLDGPWEDWIRGLWVEEGLSIEDNGRGGAIVPKRREASCFAPPPGRASSSSDDSSASDSALDQSSEFERTRAARVAADVGSGCCSCRRWKGFVDTSVAGVGTAFSFPCAIFFRNGFLDSSDGGLVMIGIAGRGGLG
jgi:hypothetical protein